MHRAYGRNVRERLRNFCCLGKAISITYAECVSVACSALPHYLINGTIFSITEYKMCGLIFSTTFV
jgi:hypothetical protein